ncbi:MAG: cation-translocating P-type ATPase, partial [Bacteroidetes bacterium]|nr:cation-translocating P-type ATPase [Bacteroidota bacterium]
ALKAANIGIAMGKRGSEIAKQAASLILVEDDLEKMIEAIALGRRIYNNLKKAIQYIISIHIPIILTVFLPLALAWKFPNIFSPIHIIFLELLMGPTCSIIYENEPIEANAMLEKPRALSSSFFSTKELSLSIVQGLIISIAALGMYQYGLYQAMSEAGIRTLIFITLIFANIFLTLVNRSFYYSLLDCLKYKNKLVPIMISLTLILTFSLLFIAPIRNFFELESLHLMQVITAIAFAFVSVIWFEAYKWQRRRKSSLA